MGGFYERMIAEFKRGMHEVLKLQPISILAFRIAMNETAHRINCRPLTHLSISHEEEEMLTPHHLAKNRPGWPLLPSAHSLKDSGRKVDERAFYVEGQKIADQITRRFYKYYLYELTMKKKWTRDQPSLKVGDLVLIIDQNHTRSAWSRGIIVSFRPTRDGVHRIAMVKTSGENEPKAQSVRNLVKIDIQSA
ncbi:hypothetical protein PVAND_017756 [Polypedilum vanderplanki]|uniref:DUF5641 domain-containing protein n=1 Tax=Polypedilum vanderplanki TaxID=319348 RepID=A0A9J6B8M9_POLVA|nr:hypothetical protein PVAND_017756 [Polypedilum vanderplanki]